MFGEALTRRHVFGGALTRFLVGLQIYIEVIVRGTWQYLRYFIVLC